MDAPEHDRFDLLRQGPCVPGQYVRDYYGLPWPLPDDLRRDFEAWQGRRPRRANCSQEEVSRYELESFLQQKSVLPKKWIAARLGMEASSLDEVLSRLNDIGMRAPRYVVYDDLIDESFLEDLAPNLPGLEFRTVSDHNSFCRRLHAEMENVLGIQVRRLFCATSDRLGEYPPRFASHFDCLTLFPVSGKHQVWLDFRKPLHLGPDRCSKLFYAENRESLRPYCAGTQEPDDLDSYIQFLAGQQNV